jgi:hypothetical protein
VLVGKRLELGACEEDRRMAARQDHRADPVVGLEEVEKDGEVVVQLPVERVRRGLVEHAPRDRVVALDAEEAGLGEGGIQTLVW